MNGSKKRGCSEQLSPWNTDVRRHSRVIRTTKTRDNRTDAGVRIGGGIRRRLMAGHHPMRRGKMSGIRVLNGSNNRQFIHHTRQKRKMFAHLKTSDVRADWLKLAAHFTGRIGFQVVHVQMTGPASHVDLNDSCRLGRVVFREGPACRRSASVKWPRANVPAFKNARRPKATVGIASDCRRSTISLTTSGTERRPSHAAAKPSLR